MDTQKVIQELLAHYTHHRQVGHTTALLEGARRIDTTVIVHDQSMTNCLRFMVDNTDLRSLDRRDRTKPVDTLSLHQIEGGCLNGRNKSITFDNGALYTLLHAVSREFERLEEKNAALEAKLDRIAGIASSR